MNAATEIADLYRRDLTRLLQEVGSFQDDDAPWRVLPGVTNSAGNLILHLEGNLREYIGRLIGGIPYQRERPLEFSTKNVPVTDLQSRVRDLLETIPNVIAALTPETLAATQPEKMSGREMTTLQYLLHLYGHFNYHLGQIDYLRRIAGNGSALPLTNV